jgi:hypothetical protein
LSFKHAVASGALTPHAICQRDDARPAEPLPCDEYEHICSADDAQFFDTSRCLGVIGIVAQAPIQSLFLTAAVFRSVLLGGFVQVMFGV